MRIAFLSHKPHLNGLYQGISISKDIEKVFLYSRFSKVSKKLINDKLELCPIKVRTFGIRFLINKLLRQDFYSPNYISGLEGNLKENKITHLILFDFFHWYIFQALRYKRKNPHISLYIWSETKEWPRRVHSRMIMSLLVRLLQRKAVLVDTIFVYTHDGMSFMKELFPNTRIEIIPAPVDTTIFKLLNQKQTLNPKDPIRILCNARFRAYKNHDDLLAAMRLLLDAGYTCQLTLIGRAESGKERVEKLVEGEGLREYVTWLDSLPTEAMPDLYRSHDVLVLPSYNEAIGMVVPEAMACGIPTITSDTVGANVYVVPNQTGLIFKTGDVEALAARLKYYIDQPETRLQHGHAAAVQTEKYYSVEKISERFLNLLNPTSSMSRS